MSSSLAPLREEAAVEESTPALQERGKFQSGAFACPKSMFRSIEVPSFSFFGCLNRC
jgi:hypothetical protein